MVLVFLLPEGLFSPKTVYVFCVEKQRIMSHNVEDCSFLGTFSHLWKIPPDRFFVYTAVLYLYIIMYVYTLGNRCSMPLDRAASTLGNRCSMPYGRAASHLYRAASVLFPADDNLLFDSSLQLFNVRNNTYQPVALGNSFQRIHGLVDGFRVQ